MFSDDALEYFRRDRVIPGAFRIHNCDRSLVANTQAVGFCAIHDVIRPRESQLLQSSFEVIPGGEPFFSRRARGFRLVGAEEDMPPDLLDPKFFDKLI
jgi:hypothetical protein